MTGHYLFLRAKKRFKDGKEHRYGSLVENRRVAGSRVVQRQVLYLGEINDSQQAAWCKTIEVLQEDGRARTLALFPEDRTAPALACEVVQIRLADLQLRHPRHWGAGWLACTWWDLLQVDDFWGERLAPNRQGTRWLNVLKALGIYRLVDPGSEWRLYRHWYEHSAISDSLGEDLGLVQIQQLYRCLDKLVEHKQALFSFLQRRWQVLFDAQFDVLLYDLTSTYFEAALSDAEQTKYGYSRDHRSDCVQVVIALIMTPDGLPLAYEVLPGNTSDKTPLADALRRIEAQYGRRRRTWVMDRGIPTEETLAAMRAADPPVHYLVGTPRGRLTRLEKRFLERPWTAIRPAVEVKLLPVDGELYVLARRYGRMEKERAMRRRRLKNLWQRLHELPTQTLTRDQRLINLGAAKKDAGRAYEVIEIHLPNPEEPVNADTFHFTLRKHKLRQVRRREGHYLLRSNLTDHDPQILWEYSIQLTEVEQAFKELKTDLPIRPIHHQRDDRIDAHLFVAFLAYCLQVTLKNRLRRLAPGLTPRAVLDTFAAMPMVDIHLPTTDGRHVILSRYTEPEPEQQLLLHQLGLQLPAQPPPKMTQRALAPAGSPTDL